MSTSTNHLIYSSITMTDLPIVHPTQIYHTLCNRYLPGKGCTFKKDETNCEHCLSVLSLMILAEVP